MFKHPYSVISKRRTLFQVFRITCLLWGSFICLQLPAIGDGNSSPLKIEISSEKPSYKIGQPILITYLLRNPSDTQGILLDSKIFTYPPSLFSIKSPSGEKLSSLSKRPEIWNMSKMLPVMLLPGGIYGVTLDLRRFYPFGFLANPHNFEVPGEYEIAAVYENVPTKSPPNPTIVKEEERRAWEGRVVSKPIIIKIEPLSKQEIDDLKQALSGKEEDAMLTAIYRVRNSKISSLLDDVANLLKADVSDKIRQNVAITLDENPKPDFFDVFLSLLEDKDGIVRSEAALGLRSLWWQKAISPSQVDKALPVLIRASDSQKYPKSYIAALGTLAQIGDPRALDVMRQALKVAPNEEVKRVLTRFIEMLENPRDTRSGIPLPPDSENK